MNERIKEFLNTHDCGFDLDGEATDNDVSELLDSFQLPPDAPEDYVLGILRSQGHTRTKS